MPYIWWDQKVIVIVIGNREGVNRDRYSQQLMNLNDALCRKRPERNTRQERLILQHENASCNRTSIIRNRTKMLKMVLLSHPPYLLDRAPSDFHLTLDVDDCE